MSRVLAFEGPDLTGKTSLIDALQRRMPYAMWPLLSLNLPKSILRESSGKTITEIETAYYSAIAAMAKTMPFILDRCYVTNYVYGSVFSREVDVEAIRAVEKILRPTIVYVYTPLEVLLERLKWRGDDFVDRSHLIQVFEMYTHWAHENPFDQRIVRVDSTETSNLDALAEVVAKNLEGFS